MTQLFLIGISAGAAAALLFASFASGSLLSMLLVYLAPLPILIAAMGWSHWAALIAAGFASASLAAVFGPYFCLTFLIGVGLPSWWLGYLTLLARPVAAAPNGLEWYPVGHLVFWVAVVSAIIVALGMLTIGAGEESFRTTLRQDVELALRARGTPPVLLPGGTGFEKLLDSMMAATMPIAGAVLTLIVGINLGLAARIVQMSGRLRRPWPQFSAMQFPTYAPAIMGVAVAGSLITGMFGLISSILMASLLTAYTVLGFAVLHAITRGTTSRPFVLGSAYAALVLLWPIVVMAMLGLALADTAFDLRGRTARPRPPNRQT